MNPPKSHPYIAEITIDPVRFQYYQRLADDLLEIKFLDVDASEADEWTMRFACASRAVAASIEVNWD